VDWRSELLATERRCIVIAVRYELNLYMLLAVPGHVSLWLSVAEFEMKGKRQRMFMMCLMSQCLLVYNILCCTIVCKYVQATPFLTSLHL
jgi:hypothetical protein